MTTVCGVQRRVLTAPNAITLLRLLFLPVVPWLLLVEDRQVAAAVVLGVLGSTDWVDGWVARRFGQTSEFGAVFDPVVDRLLFIVGALSVLADGSIPAWFLMAVVAREVFVGGMMVTGTFLGMERFGVSPWGKRYTFVLMMAIPLLMLGSGGGAWTVVPEVLGWLLGGPALAIGWIVGFAYVPIVRTAVGRAREVR